MSSQTFHRSSPARSRIVSAGSPSSDMVDLSAGAGKTVAGQL
jgi:hypothetical protein